MQPHTLVQTPIVERNEKIKCFGCRIEWQNQMPWSIIFRRLILYKPLFSPELIFVGQSQPPENPMRWRHGLTSSVERQVCGEF